MTRMLSTLNFALLGLIGSLSLPALAADDAPAAGGDAASSSTPAPSENDRPPLLFGKGVEVGGYGGLDAAYTRMFGRDGLVVGGQGAVLINHRLALGLAGYGWSNPLTGPNAANGDAQRFETGYGGFTAHYSFYFDALPVYFTVGTLVGAGAINLTDENHSDGNEASDDVFAIVQPDIAVHANLTRWMRVGLTGSYRVTSGVNQLGFKESDVNGAMVGAQIQFGSF
jgi:hypothetical protein